MIRDRRPEDLDPLVAVLRGLDEDGGVLHGRDPDAWLRAVDAEWSWVFDQAPVTVAPTANVVGHVQVAAAVNVDGDGAWASRLDVPVEEVAVVGRLFVAPVRHSYGVARYLLGQAVARIEASGRRPVLDPDGIALVPPALPARLGFTEVVVDGRTAVWTR